MAAANASYIYNSALIIGASEARNLYSELNDPENRRPPMCWNFGLDENDAQVYCDSVRGRTIVSTHSERLASVEILNPDVVLLAVGGNDLAVIGHDGRPEVVGYRLSNLAECLHNNYGVHRVMVSSIGPRFPPYCGRVYPADYNHRVSVCNQYLDAVLESTEGVTFWNHAKQFNWGDDLYLSDGVHFNYKGTKRWYKSLRGALIKAFKNMA